MAKKPAKQDNAIQSIPTGPEDIAFIDLNDLLLDPANPRLPESVPRDQQSMLDHISETTSIEELMVAIAENDFFPGEPVIVVPYDEQKGKFVVVEGNRRLTAVKLLLNPGAATNPSSRIRDISTNAKHRPSTLPTIKRQTRGEILPYLGFRHITGVKQWEPLAKARYIEQLFQLMYREGDNPRNRYSTVASAIGSRREHIKRNLDALAVYKVLRKNDFYDIEGLDDESLKFAVLSTALADERIGAFTGVAQKVPGKVNQYEPTDPIIDPSKLNENEVEELTRWLFERDPKGKTVVGESRNLRMLSAVVDSPRALNALRGGSPLKVAYQYTSDLTKDFSELLYEAEALVKEAASMVATIEYEEDSYQVARSIFENIKMIGRELKDKRGKDDEF